MSVRLFGRKSFFRGKSLADIVAQLKNVNGRVVGRLRFDRYPEKSYYILTRGNAYNDGENMRARVWAYEVFRGYKFPEEREIEASYKKDFFLVPKEEEEEFCKINQVYAPKKEIPESFPLPPTLAHIVKRELTQKNISFTEPLECERVFKEGYRRRSSLELDSYVEDIQNADITQLKSHQEQNITVCRSPLGFSYGHNLTSINFTASATEGNASDARLNGPRSWTTNHLGQSSYLEIRSSRTITVTGMLVQGDKDTGQWVTSLMVKYSMDCSEFYSIMDGRREKVFAGNVDAQSDAMVDFNNVVVARCIRVIPVERHGNKTALRLDLLGCTTSSCSNNLHGEWNVNAVHEKLEIKFPSEKLISFITIKNDFHRNTTYAVSHSRSCAEYNDIDENGEVKRFFSMEGEDIVIDLTLRPLRVLCLKVTSLDADISDVNDVTVQLVGCGAEELGPGLSVPRNWRVVVGEHNQADRDGTEQVFNIVKIIKHPRFVISEDEPFLHDIALLQLDKPAILSDYVNVICLDMDDAFPPGTPCVAAGWGQNQLTGTGVKLPLHAEIPIIHPDVCDERYRSIPEADIRNFVSIQESVLCATTEGGDKDSCWGDSGGPLVCRRGDHWTQVGIVSFGYQCGNSDYPGIYTKVSFFIDWISRTVQENSDAQIQYTWHMKKKAMGTKHTF
ncbi:hypothetical protein FSP39_002116 [Pinctada imbricata]|uniref:Uncharacterized protein n=1 Tax=Pinctada imbricata TaxID=66713 RepID=A0AA88XP86_PINIB|nr:hypothetical protein FSP39_002116 [Pinctada imbricata]